jgi:hypothetical protein
MSTRLSATNPYLRDPVVRARSVLRSVATSSAIEGIHAPFKKKKDTSSKCATSVKRERSAKG